MGWLAFAVSNVVFTSLTMGFLKRQGVLHLQTEKLSNPTLRMVLEKAVDGGEVVIVTAENFWNELSKK